MDNSILALEGALQRVKRVPPDGAEDLLKGMRNIIKDTDKAYEYYLKHNFFNIDQFKEKFIYTQKLIYKIESVLYRIVYKKKEIYNAGKS